MALTPRPKLIEVALPLEAINLASAREKSIRHGHPSTLHLWWARRPLATARAVLFAQLVDDPSGHPEKFPTLETQQAERKRLHRLIERMVVWENSQDEALFAEAHAEIVASCDGNPPPILDPFAGGGTIPLEAQRLGLEAHASDLNPVAVLICKALIEIPPKFRDWLPVFPELAESRLSGWSGVDGLAADVRAYGQWMRDEAEQRIGHLYPKATLSDGTKANVIAWNWTRTVTCPNPGCGIDMPLVRSWWLGKKKGREAYVIPTVTPDPAHSSGKCFTYTIGHDPQNAPTAEADGTIGRTGATCTACTSAVPLKYIRAEGRAKRLSFQLMAVVAEGTRQRVYLPPTGQHVSAAAVPAPQGSIEGSLGFYPRDIKAPTYGLTDFTDLFTNRQLTTLTTFSDLVAEARERVLKDALGAGLPPGDRLEAGGTNAEAYADAVATYLGMTISRLADLGNSLCRWEPNAECPRQLFARQAIPMVWDFAEANPLGGSSGSWRVLLDGAGRAFASPAFSRTDVKSGRIGQADAITCDLDGMVISTDPPYYDNIGYSDLSDFFYVWLRRSLRPVYEELLSTVLVPKAEELVANPHRHGGKEFAQTFFEEGFRKVFAKARDSAWRNLPITVFYAFKQSESTLDGEISTGWETLLDAMTRCGWSITATWPMRTETSSRMAAQNANALASSIVLVLRPRPEDAPSTDRRGFISALQQELPGALKDLQQGAIAPVDLPQAAIGPGMAVYTRYSSVIEADGSPMPVRAALARINEVLDQVINEQEGDFDGPTRFAIAWYRQHGYDTGTFGAADNLARARGTAVEGLDRAGILSSRAGKVTLLSPADLPTGYDPRDDEQISVWEVTQHLIRVLECQGVTAAGRLLGHAQGRPEGAIPADLVKELAFLLFRVADGNTWAKDAVAFNTLATSWTEIADAAGSPDVEQFALDLTGEH